MDFIKKLISGILDFVTGLLRGKKKSNGYFLELDEAKDAAKDAAQEVASNAKKVAETVVSNAKKVTATIGGSEAPKAPEASKPASLNGTKTAAAKTKEKPAKNPKPADVTLVQTAEGLKVEPGKKAKAAAAKVLKEEPKETTFAPKYLSPSATSSNGRRRPGANMSAYLDMARQVKTPG
ncbi:hypothetical protein NIES4072_11650 [Nostoc commune NIES-4072]|uniref:Uncharacterized protein n=1 Tax=Nostoc commune NIES-4072 TaxID=2005467 RepID=A0A2R5FH48_NOSCO|nr:hypothetical protein [Nostoc commune]BBD65170.1 hypothetical protein NIES4070_15170 [Nostoc commune HK-02]GBG17505.1 hypothetical protein NIES4072_11650 [Nostoc commune NIES-4072]